MEVTNWQEEQHAWRNTAILFDQSHHMPELFLDGPDAFRLLNFIGINSFANFRPGMAKQFVGCSPTGYVIGDCILYYLPDGSFELISGMTLLDWVEYNAQFGGYDVKIRRDHATPNNPHGRTRFRFGMDGPAAWTIFQELVDGHAPELAFFRIAEISLAGCSALAMRHGMAGHKGVELSGSYADGEKVKAAILAAGAKHNIRAGGRLAYFSSALESGWIPYPLPAIYTDPEMISFRRWLRGKSWEASTHIAGSFLSDRIEDYYTTVWDLGYDRILKFDHEFIGRAAIERMAASQQRKKISLEWNAEDLERIYGSLFKGEEPFKQLSLPLVSYGFPQCDEVRTPGGKLVGLSSYAGYSANEKKVISLGSVDANYAVPGTKLHLVWGEPGSKKPRVELHRQTLVRVTVADATNAETVRALKRASLGPVCRDGEFVRRPT
jgi:glycine cleavage system aminomethyltransferase T